MKKDLLKAATVAILALPAAAGAETWEKAVTLYGWIPDFDASIATNYGDLETSPSGGDILKNLDMVFMGTFEATKGRWSFIKDLLYVDLSSEKDTPFGLLFANGEIDVKMTAATGYAAYNIHESDRARYELAAGVRYFALETEATLNAGRLPTESARIKEDWFVPVIGIRGNWVLGDKWSATGFVDYGRTFSGSSETWQVLGTVNYSFNDAWSGRFGYRHMELEKDVKGRDVDIGLSGPIIGVSYRF